MDWTAGHMRRICAQGGIRSQDGAWEGLETPSARTGSDSEGNGLKRRRCGKEARNAWTGGENRRLGRENEEVTERVRGEQR